MLAVFPTDLKRKLRAGAAGRHPRLILPLVALAAECDSACGGAADCMCPDVLSLVSGQGVMRPLASAAVRRAYAALRAGGVRPLGASVGLGADQLPAAVGLWHRVCDVKGLGHLSQL